MGFWDAASKSYGPAYQASASEYNRTKREDKAAGIKAGREKIEDERKDKAAKREEARLGLAEKEGKRRKQETEWKTADRKTAETMRFMKESVAMGDQLLLAGQSDALGTLVSEMYKYWPDGGDGGVVMKSKYPEEEWAKFGLDDGINVAVLHDRTGVTGYKNMSEAWQQLKAMATPEQFSKDLNAAKATVAKENLEAEIVEFTDGTRRKPIFELDAAGRPIRTGRWSIVQEASGPVPIDKPGSKAMGLEAALKRAKSPAAKKRTKQVYGVTAADKAPKASKPADSKLKPGKIADINKDLEADYLKAKEAAFATADQAKFEKPGYKKKWKQARMKEIRGWVKGEEGHTTKIAVNPKTKKRTKFTFDADGKLVKKESL